MRLSVHLFYGGSRSPICSMRFLFASVALAIMGSAASAQPVAPCSYDDCVLAETSGGFLSFAPTFVRGTDSVRVAGGRLADAFYGPALVAHVEGVSEAVAHAQTYERTRTPELVSGLAFAAFTSAALLASDLPISLFDERARPAFWVGAAVSYGVSIAFNVRGDRAKDRALETYNETLPRGSSAQ